MLLKPELQALTVVSGLTILMWLPYTLARIRTRGAAATMANPSPDMPRDPDWGERARRAHANAVENLVVFAPVVLVAALAEVSTPVTVAAAWTYVGARIVHYLVYAAGIPVVRTLAFAVGVFATLAIVAALLPAF